MYNFWTFWEQNIVFSIIYFQPVRFKLNHNSTRLMPGERDHSLWVGDLTPEVDDFIFYKFFAARFQTVKSAKGNYDKNLK